MQKKFYITTTLPYVNAAPHIGFALEIIQVDSIARYKRMAGYDAFFNTGTDEHGIKVYRKAREEGKDTQKYVDEYAAKFDDLKKALNLSYDSFIRTTDVNHVKAAQEFWKRCFKAGDIYKKKYKTKYCVGCEAEKTESELINDCCSVHPNLKIEVIEEENYFFRLSKYQKKLADFYEKNPGFVIPSFRFNEIKNFIKNGLEDFSISRLKEKMPWGIPAPDDEKHVMYVWFDALVNYISALGWPDNAENFRKYWPAVQLAGKDNLRFQSLVWQAMLMSAGVPPSRRIVIHGFITSGGQKMSKSLGNVVNPYDVVAKYGADALRYYLTREITPFEDGDFIYEKFEESYTANLANGLGNLVARSLAMAEKIKTESGKWKVESGTQKSKMEIDIENYWKKYEEAINNYKLNEAMNEIWKFISACDEYIEENKPWKLEGNEKEEAIYNLLESLRHIAWMLRPFMPETSDKIFSQLFADEKERAVELSKVLNEAQKWGGMKIGAKIKKGAVLFPRLKV
ncbi:MAG: methionine--tRNA ligase [Patescibacteria group bacterium]